MRKFGELTIISAVACLALASAHSAEAKYRFQCGIYQVYGKVRGFEPRKDPPKDGKEGVLRSRMPLLVLWDGSLSRTEIPLKVDAEFQSRFEAIASKEPVLGEFVIDVRGEGMQPRPVALQKFSLPPAQVLVNGAPEPKLLRAGPCDAVAARKLGKAGK